MNVARKQRGEEIQAISKKQPVWKKTPVMFRSIVYAPEGGRWPTVQWKMPPEEDVVEKQRSDTPAAFQKHPIR